MSNTLVTYESEHGTAKRVAGLIGRIVCNAKVVAVEEAGDDLSQYGALVTVFSFNGAHTMERTMSWLSSVASKMDGIPEGAWGVVGVGLSERGFDHWIEELEKAAGRSCAFDYFVRGEMRVDRLTDEERAGLEAFCAKHGSTLEDRGALDMAEAARTADKIADLLLEASSPEEGTEKMPEDELRAAIDGFIEERNTCALATCSSLDDGVGLPHVTPLEYQYIEGVFYVITEGGRKYRGLVQSEHVSLAIFDVYDGMGHLKSLQIDGTVQLLEQGDEGYIRPFRYRNISPVAIANLPIDMHVMKITPERYLLLDSSLKERGYDAHQMLENH